MKTYSGHAAARAGLITSVALIAIVQGCSSGRGPSERPGTSTAATTIVCGSFPVYDHGTVTQQPEYYFLPVINRKLSSFPDLAKSVEMQSVSDCEGARRFDVGYRRYVSSHPNVNLSLALGPEVREHIEEQIRKERLAAGKQQLPQPGRNVAKIFQGSPTGLLPVVQISHKLAFGAHYFDNSGPIGKGSACSGAFIAKNFILTAAHCLGDIDLQNLPITDPFWISSTLWTIEFADNQGHFNPDDVSLQLTTYVVSLADPNYYGVTNPTNCDAFGLDHNGIDGGDPNANPPILFECTKAANDVAILYVDPYFNDGRLLPETTGAPPSAQTMLSVSIAPFDPSWTLRVFGWGVTSDTDPGSVLKDADTLNAGLLSPSVAPFEGIGEIIAHTAASIDGTTILGSTTCEGDSGGPLVRDVGNGKFAIVGVTSRFRPAHVRDPPVQCADRNGDTMEWASAAAEEPFIRDTIDAFEPGFKCTDSGDQTYMSCWGAPCFSSCDCNPDNYCSNPAVLDPSSPFREGTNFCTACLDGTCNCIRGQCLPRPNNFDGGDMNSDGGCDGM